MLPSPSPGLDQPIATPQQSSRWHIFTSPLLCDLRCCGLTAGLTARLACSKSPRAGFVRFFDACHVRDCLRTVQYLVELRTDSSTLAFGDPCPVVRRPNTILLQYNHDPQFQTTTWPLLHSLPAPVHTAISDRFASLASNPVSA
jgi:hypothetical protein